MLLDKFHLKVTLDYILMTGRLILIQLESSIIDEFWNNTVLRVIIPRRYFWKHEIMFCKDITPHVTLTFVNLPCDN